MGYSLAAIGAAAEDTWLDTTAGTMVASAWWVGGVQGSEPGCVEPAGCWGWDNGEAWSYVNWYPGEPNEYLGASEDCIEINNVAATVGWVDNACSLTVPFVCEQDCFSETYGGHAYLFCTGARDWAAARDACSAHGYHLVTVDDAAEDAWLGTTATGYRAARWWMGISDQATEGTWVWVSGSSAFRNWCAGQPDNNLGNQDCGAILHSCARPLNWDDERCDMRMPYVCERP